MATELITKITAESAGSTPYEFDSLVKAGSNTLVPTTAQAKAGTYSYLMTADGTNINNYGIKAWTTAQAKIYTKFSVYIDSSFNLPDVYQSAIIFELLDSGNNELLSLKLARGEGSNITSWHVEGSSITAVSSTTNYSTNAWHDIEIYWYSNGVNSSYWIKVDGTTIFSEGSLNFYSATAKKFWVGVFGSVAPIIGSKIYFDEIDVFDDIPPVSPTYTATYDGNGNTGGTAPTDGSSPYASGATVTVLSNTGNLVKTGNVFKEWNTAANGSGTAYQPAATFNINANTILYAQWVPVYSVTYDGNSPTSGNPPTDSNTYQNGASVTVLTNSGTLVKTNYIFGGWNTAANGSGTTYQPGSSFNMGSANITLYTLWVDIAGALTSIYNQDSAIAANVAAIKAITDKIAFTGSNPYYINAQVKGQDNIDFGALQKASLNAATPSSGGMLATTIATLASQISFTLTDGSPDDDAYNDCIAIITNASDSTKKCVGAISAYVGSTKTITLLADPAIFTMAVGDSITIVATMASLLASDEDLASAVSGSAAGLVSRALNEGTKTEETVAGVTTVVFTRTSGGVTTTVTFTIQVDGTRTTVISIV